MGILTDFVIANDDEGDAIGKALRPADRWPTLEAKGVDPINLSTLYCAITGTNYSNSIQKSFQLAGGNQDEGPWIFKFPNNILESFASIQPANIQAVAEKWAATEELKMGRWSSTDAAEFIRLLHEHSQNALTKKACMFLWLSL